MIGRNVFVAFAVTPILLLSLALPLFADERLERLPPEYRKWIEEEVVYIITERERDVFLSLETQEERAHFVEAFWRRRDPDPATPVNEIQEEHYRRIAYANDVYGRDTHRPGWRTDRGRYYIVLGPPLEVQPYDSPELVSLELWFYESDPATGLPPFFYLLFFRRNDIGEYRLYHPGVDGPQALLVGQPGSVPTRMALGIIGDVSKELARASMSLDPSDPADSYRGEPSRGSDLLLARIDDAPNKAVSADYLDAFVRYRDRVSADYSFNYFPNRALFAVLAGPEGTPFVHFDIEIDPQHFNLQASEDETRYYTTVEVGIEARRSDGKLIAPKEREIFMELTRGQFLQARAFPIAFHDVFPLVPGQYDVSVILKNRVLSQYTVAEQTIQVEPVSVGEPSIRDVVLGYGSRVVPESDGVVRPFRVAGLELHPTAEAVFAIGDNVEVLTQLEGAEDAHRLRIELLSGEESLLERESAVGRAAEGAVLTQISLAGIDGGRYTLQVELRRPSGELLARESTPLLVSPRSELGRPGFISRRGFNAAVPGVLALEAGEQYLELGDHDRAKELLQRAVAADNPDLPMARWRLATVLLRSGEVNRSLQILLPMESLHPNQFEVVAGLGFGFYFKQNYEIARDYFERAMTLRPPDTNLLNALGDCYQILGDTAKAKETFERSLGLNPDQDAVKERLKSLGGQPQGGGRWPG